VKVVLTDSRFFVFPTYIIIHIFYNLEVFISLVSEEIFCLIASSYNKIHVIKKKKRIIFPVGHIFNKILLNVYNSV
jgi:hypothetical protein